MISALDSLYSCCTKINPSKFTVSENDKLNTVICEIAKKLKISVKGVMVFVSDHKKSIENKNIIYISPIWLASSFKNKDDLKAWLHADYSPEMIDFMYHCLTHKNSKKIFKHLIASNLIALERQRQTQELTDGRLDILLFGIVAMALLRNGCQSMPLIFTIALSAVIAHHIFFIKAALREQHWGTPFQAAIESYPKTKSSALDFERHLLAYEKTLSLNDKVNFNPLIPFQLNA